MKEINFENVAFWTNVSINLKTDPKATIEVRRIDHSKIGHISYHILNIVKNKVMYKTVIQI